MPDAPDWYQYHRASVRHVMGDLGELAARLGSPDVFDRRGTVAWIYDFRHGVKTFALSSGGGGHSIKLGAIYAGIGGHTMRMTTGTASPWQAEATKYFNPFYLDKWGLEVAIAFTSACKYFSMWIQYDDGVTLHKAGIFLHDDDNKINYLNYQNLGMPFMDLGKIDNPYGLFHVCKLVADFENDEYVRFIFDKTEYPFTDTPIYVNGGSDTVSTRIGLSLIGNDGDNDVCDIDYVIVTTGEP